MIPIYNRNNLKKDLEQWRDNLKKIVRTTGMTNYELLKNNEFFQAKFPFVTSSDKLVINKLLAEMQRLRK